MIPAEALDAAKEAMREVTPPPGISKADWLAEHGTWALFAGAIAAAAPYIAARALADAGIDGTLHAMTTDAAPTAAAANPEEGTDA